jgi:histidine triad (HIT) family protein
MKGCIFCKIRDRVIPKEFTYEDDDIMVFPDINPVRKIHLLIIPKKHIKDLLIINDKLLITNLFKTVQKMIKKFKLENKGYRVTINGGGAQVIDHLHIHLLGPMGKASPM